MLHAEINVVWVFNRKRIHSRETLGQVLQEVSDTLLISLVLEFSQRHHQGLCINTESHVLTSGLNLNVLIYLLQTDNSKAVNLFWFVLFLSQKSSIC